MPSKRHHYVPEAYLRAFTDSDGQLTVFRKCSPTIPFRTSPTNVALEQYYYAFTRDDDVRDTDSLEQVFSEVETGWPHLVAKLSMREASDEMTHDLLQFACLQRARVPAIRDAYELMRADNAGHIAQLLQRLGKLPEAPAGSQDILERVEIAIDPESSLKAIGITLNGIIERILPMLGFRVFHNQTRVDFITSDNPVIWFIPYKNDEYVKPYEMRPKAPLEFFFPLTPRLLLVGLSYWSEDFHNRGLSHANLRNIEAVRRANRMLTKFGYDAVFATDASPAPLVMKYADISPVMHTTAYPRPDGQLIAVHMEFSQRRTKVKWRPG